MAHQTKNTKNGGSPSRGEEGSVGSGSSPGGVSQGSGGGGPATSVSTTNNAPKYGTVVPNRIFVGGISPSTTELDLTHLFSPAYGRVTATKIIQDRGGVSKGYGFVTFETEEEAKRVLNDSENIVLKERRLNIAPAVKKQGFSRTVENGTVVVPQPAQLYQQNGVSYSYHNGMAFFNGSHPQQSVDPTIYPSYTAAAPPQMTQFAPVLYSAQMYYQGPQQYPTTQYQIPIEYGNCDVCTQYPGVGEGVYEGSGTEVFGGGSGGYPGGEGGAAPQCYPIQAASAYPTFHEYRRVLTIPQPPPTTHYYEPHYIEVPQYPFYQAVLPPSFASPHHHHHQHQVASPQQPPPASSTQTAAVQTTNHRRPSTNHQQRRNTSGRRGRGGSRSGSSGGGGGGGDPLTPPTTPRSSPPPHSATPIHTQHITSSVQALAM